MVFLNVCGSECTDTPGAPRQWWFGGGTDFTPAYIFEEDVRHFHQVNSSMKSRSSILSIISDVKLMFRHNFRNVSNYSTLHICEPENIY